MIEQNENMLNKLFFKNENEISAKAVVVEIVYINCANLFTSENKLFRLTLKKLFLMRILSANSPRCGEQKV